LECLIAESATASLSSRHALKPTCAATCLFPCLQVLLLSARNALLSRLVLAGRADAANSQRFARVAFGSFNPRIASNRSAELVKAAAEDMLQGSGVPELEERVLGFLFEAAAGLKLVAILDDMGRLMNEVRGGLLW
jgi:hypothetical protein